LILAEHNVAFVRRWRTLLGSTATLQLHLFQKLRQHFGRQLVAVSVAIVAINLLLLSSNFI
jgi:hypothetical protein